jgi:hypothetical protein
MSSRGKGTKSEKEIGKKRGKKGIRGSSGNRENKYDV